ncbi:MAG: DUF2961 domain-containing protein [Mucilaginibacter polytrichastri]|nr:DUF2961 domain-containing protein [Mucilaginibacter polytrichastri]
MAGCAMQLYAQKAINTLSELKNLYDISGLPSYADGAVVSQFSSYDRTGNNDDGFSGKYSFIRKNADSSLGIFEAKGKGVINRIWTPTPTNDTLDFYFDGHRKPDLSIRFSDLFSGRVFPFEAPLCANQLGGYFCYVPIAYQKGCRIVFRGKKLEFYQIQYRALPGKEKVNTFSTDFTPEEKAALASVQELWVKKAKETADFTTEKFRSLHTDTTLAPGDRLTLADVQQGGRILGMQIGPAQNFEGLLRQLDLRITWDGEKTPAVNAPAADFFGYAFGTRSMQSLLIGSENNRNYSFFPMPFDRSARVELVYRKTDEPAKQEPLRIQARIDISGRQRDPKTEGKFYAFWNRDIRPENGKPHIFLEGSGRGHYVGTALQAQGLQAGMTLFFEGDDSTVVDGKLRMHGTGSEDYFNGGWYALMDRWDRRMSLPLHGALDYSLPFSRTGGYRLFISDKMPFAKSLHHSIEHGPEHNRFPVDYTSMAYYYAEAPLAVGKTPVNALTKTWLPDTLMIYPQLMQLTFAGDILVRGEEFQAKNGGEIRIDLSEIPAGEYRLLTDTETGPDGAQIECWQRQTQRSKDISFYSAEKKDQQMMPLCDLRIDEFSNTVTFHLKADPEKHVLRIRRLILVRK